MGCVRVCRGGTSASRFFATEKAARAFAAEARAEIEPAVELWERARHLQALAERALEDAARAESRSLTVRDAIERYLDNLAKRGRKDGTVTNARHRLRAVVGPVLDVPVRAITARKAQELYKTRVAQGVSAATHQGDAKRARALWRWLGERGFTYVNVWQSVELEGRVSKGKLQLHADEAVQFDLVALERATNPPRGWHNRFAREAAIAVLCGLHLALRPGEIVALVARDVDQSGKVLWVAEDGGKTETSRRRVKVYEPLDELLAGRAAELGPGDRLFPHRREWVYDNAQRICKLAGVPVVCAHALRGTHATLATEAGETARAVAATLGHASTVVTDAHYTRPEAKAAARQRAMLTAIRGGKK